MAHMIISSMFIEPGGKDCYGHYCQPLYHYKMKCDNCGTEFETFNYRKKYCCENCTNQAGIKNRKEKKSQARKRKCQVCGELFIPPRNDAKFCSDKCKQSAYRERKKESKPFLLEFYRLSPELCPDETGKTGFFNSSLYKNGIGFERLIEEWKESSEINNNVDIKLYQNGENSSKQSLYKEYNRQKLTKYKLETRRDLEYPFLVLLENDKIVYIRELDPHDGLTRNLAFTIICESIEYRDKAKKFGLLGVEYSEALDQFARWKEEKEKAEKKKASIEKAKVTREANILKKQMI